MDKDWWSLKRNKLNGGWRKDVYIVEDENEKRVLATVSKDKISRLKFERSIRLENNFYTKGIPSRKLIDFGVSDNNYWVVFDYIDGEIKWQWDSWCSYKLGRFLCGCHQKCLFHMDVKPGNVIWKNGEIVGLIDFEEAKIGEEWLDEDMANTLSWVLISGGNREEFFRGYEKSGNKINRDRMKKILKKYLKKRLMEDQKNAFIILAKERLEEYKKRVSSKLLKIKDLKKYRRVNKNKKIVFLVGAFELLHWGHLKFLKKSKENGDLLVLGVASDASRRRLKGKAFPLIGQKTRIETLAHFGVIDAVIVVNEENVLKPLEKLKPNVMVIIKKDIEEGTRKIEEIELVRKNGGLVKMVNYCTPSIASSKIIKMVALKKIESVLGKKSRTNCLLKVKNGHRTEKNIEFKNLPEAVGQYREKKKTIAFTSLSADLFHLGHARFIQKAKSLADVLIVGTPSNESIRRLKGEGRPIVDETARMKVLAELPYVDKVVIFDQDTVLACLEKIKPDVFFTVKEDWNKGIFESNEAKFMKSYGGKIVLSERMAPYISASMMIDKAAGELIKNHFAQVLDLANKTEIINADFNPLDPANQLTAREKGFYDQVLKEVERNGKCVFCDLKEKYIIDEDNKVVLTVALYPYLDGHLLVIPRRHVETIDDLTEEEKLAVFRMKKKGCQLLKSKLGVENSWFLVREGDGIKAGKTVNHVHFHLIPYDSNVIKMVESKLQIKPIDLAKNLKNELR